MPAQQKDIGTLLSADSHHKVTTNVMESTEASYAKAFRTELKVDLKLLGACNKTFRAIMSNWIPLIKFMTVNLPSRIRTNVVQVL